MKSYYSTNLNAERLKRVYDIAPPRVQQYLQAEIRHVVSKIKPGNRVLELGCGYGRVMKELAADAAMVVGIDISIQSLLYGMETYDLPENCYLACMNAAHLGLQDDLFDVVACIQNGPSALNIELKRLLLEALRVAKPGGQVLLSSYSVKFWLERLRWFKVQSEEGLLGVIDTQKTREGNIVCTDGFTARTISPAEFRSLADSLGVAAVITEVDSSSLFCEIRKEY